MTRHRASALLMALVAAASGQVVVDTIVRLPYDRIESLLYIPEGNKLYVNSGQGRLVVLDCATWEVVAEIPTHADYPNSAYGTWNPVRHKAYYVFNPVPDSIMIVDTRSDSVVGWIPFEGIHRPTYVPSNDRVYVADLGLHAVDCANDSLHRVVPAGQDQECGPVFWDSVGDKVYVGCDPYQSGDLLLAYSCSGDTLVSRFYCRAIDPMSMVFSPDHRRAYVQGFWGRSASAIDTRADTVVRTWPWFWAGSEGVLCPVEDKAYLVTDDSLMVIDCATDSVLRKLHVPYVWRDIRWVPWSNRLYVAAEDYGGPGRQDYVRVYDCRNDSVLVPRIEVPPWPADMAVDEVNRRVYMTCYRDSSIYVFRDDEPGVEEETGARLEDEGGRLNRTVYRTPELARLDCRVIDALGRDVTDVKEVLSPGVYFLTDEGGRLKDEPGSRMAVRKVIVQR